MSRYRKVDPRIWNDAKFMALSNHAKLVFFYLLTHPHMTALGAMRSTPSGLAEELGWPPEAFRKAFAEVIDKGMAEHDQRACLIALPKFLRYNQPESPNVVKAWVGALDLLPECDLKTAVVTRAGAIADDMPDAFGKAFREAFGKTCPNQEPKQKPKPKKTPPHPPAGGSERFEEFWTEWPTHPRKAARDQCVAKWRTRGCEPIADVVLGALRAQKASKQWTKDGGEFIPSPLVWLNQSRWEAPTEEDAESAHWTETRKGIEDKGEALGIGRWDQSAWERGEREAWPVYLAKVYKAAGVELRAA